MLEAILISAALAATPAPTDPTGSMDIHCGAVFDARAAKFSGPWRLRIVAGRIESIVDDDKPDAGDVDLSAHWCLPGLIDLHTHLTTEYNRARFAESFQLDPADLALRSTRHARATVEAGFTTVRDLGDGHELSRALRSAIDRGDVIGPRIYTSGKSIASTGGHADPTNGRNRALRGDPGPAEGVINSAADARKAVRQRYKEGSDWIKITATGGVLSLARSPDNPQFNAEELTAIIETARDYGMDVAAHAHGAEGMKRAVLAGVRTIEHGSFMTEEVMKLMKQRGTYLVPTLTAGWWVGQQAEIPGEYAEIVRPKARLIGQTIIETFKRAQHYGVPWAFGTDAGVFPHGMNAKEFELLVGAGIEPAEALQAATLTAAQVLRAEGQLGELVAGAHADLVAFAADPTADVTTLMHPVLVLKAGNVIVDRRDPPAATAARSPLATSMPAMTEP